MTDKAQAILKQLAELIETWEKTGQPWNVIQRNGQQDFDASNGLISHHLLAKNTCVVQEVVFDFRRN